MQKLASQIHSFVSQNIHLELILNPKDFPESPYDYLFYPSKSLAIHCVSFETLIDNPAFFQKIGLSLAQKNIKVVHIWEDIWQNKRAIVESRLMSLFGKSDTIPARLTQVQRIDKPTLDKFLIDNHLQSKANAKLKYGLFLPKRYFRVIKNEAILHEILAHDSLLVAVASFSNPKKFIREGQEYRSYEMVRFASYRGLTVVGGLNKLLKKFIEEHSPDDIMTYADADWSDGTNYEKIGFERIELTQSLIFQFDSETFMRGIADGNSENKIYNSGNWKFLMKLKK